MVIKSKAIEVRQSDFRLFSTSLSVGTLLLKGVYSVEPLNPRDPKTGKYQRELIPGRAEEIGKYVLRALKNKDFFMPTSILLATENRVDYDEASGTISFNTDKKKNEADKERIGPFSVVDGQHRLGGMREAIKLLREGPKTRRESKMHAEWVGVTVEDVENIEMNVLLVDGIAKSEQSNEFLVVNTTQKTLDKNLVWELHSNAIKESKDGKINRTLPAQTEKEIRLEKNPDAEEILRYLNQEGSPWHGRIRMAHDKVPKGKSILKKSSFANVIKKFVLNKDRLAEDLDELKESFLNYWKAVDKVLSPTEGQNVNTLWLINGAGVFSAFFNDLFECLHNKGLPYTEENFENYLRKVFEEYKGDQRIDTWQFWQKGSTGGRMNKAEFKYVRISLQRALREVRIAESS